MPYFIQKWNYCEYFETSVYLGDKNPFYLDYILDTSVIQSFSV